MGGISQMQEFVDLILVSGRTGIELSLYIVMPVMVIMMALMKVLDEKGVLIRVARCSAPFLLIFGLPGLGIFAILQMLFVSFAAPVSTLKLMEKRAEISDAHIGATLAAILVMAQANAAFPLAVVGLNIPIGIASSFIAGLAASLIAYKLIGDKSSVAAPENNPSDDRERNSVKTSIISLLFKGGEEGMEIAIKSIPPLILAVFLVNILRMTSIINYLEVIFSPLLNQIGIPSSAVLPIITKFIAGGTAMVAVVIDSINAGTMSAVELNRVAGFTLNPLDPVGLAVLMAAGPRVVRVARPAIIAAVLGIIFRGIIHLIIF